MISEHESEGEDRAERGAVSESAAPSAGRPGHPGRGRRAARQAGVAPRAATHGERRRGKSAGNSKYRISLDAESRFRVKEREGILS